MSKRQTNRDLILEILRIQDTNEQKMKERLDKIEVRQVDKSEKDVSDLKIFKTTAELSLKNIETFIKEQCRHH